MTVERCFQVFDGLEVMALKRILNATIGAFDHAVGLAELRRSQAVLDPELSAGFVERVLPRRGAPGLAEETASYLLAVACRE